MSEDGEDERSESGTSVESPARVSIAFLGPPLALPGEEHESNVPQRVGSLRSESRQSSDHAGGHDAWTTSRRTPLPEPCIPEPPIQPQASAVAQTRTDRTTELPACQGDAIELVDARPSEPAPRGDLKSEMAACFALGDFSGALQLAEIVLGRDERDADAKRYAASSRRRLEDLYMSRLGSRQALIRLLVPDHEIRWLGLDPQAAFLLSRVDGATTLDELIAISGMPTLETLKLLCQLFEAGAIDFAS